MCLNHAMKAKLPEWRGDSLAVWTHHVLVRANGADPIAGAVPQEAGGVGAWELCWLSLATTSALEIGHPLGEKAHQWLYKSGPPIVSLWVGPSPNIASSFATCPITSLLASAAEEVCYNYNMPVAADECLQERERENLDIFQKNEAKVESSFENVCVNILRSCRLLKACSGKHARPFSFCFEGKNGGCSSVMEAQVVSAQLFPHSDKYW